MNLSKTGDIKQAWELVLLGGKFYELDGEAWCDTAFNSWRLTPGVGYICQE